MLVPDFGFKVNFVDIGLDVGRPGFGIIYKAKVIDNGA